MRFVIVTGMSGGGKSTALRMLEDAGFYCVDNLPVLLIEKFVELIAMPNSEVTKVALGLDVRADQSFEDVEKILHKLRDNGYSFEILFMEAGDAELLKRYKETRRVHPLSPDGRIEDGIRREREILKNMKSQADYVMSFEEAHIFIDKLTDMIKFLIPNYVKEGKYQLVIGIGCTGGKHRSVTLANRLYEELKDQGDYGLKIAHRDVGQGI